MSVRNSLLAILTVDACYGFQLKSEFERRTGGVWPVNVGQVYTTLARLSRDGLVAKRAESGAGRDYFEITDAGRAAVADWFRSPVPAASAQRDELPMKLALAVTLPGADAETILGTQWAWARARRAELETAGAATVPTARLALAYQEEQLAAQERWIERARAELTVPPAPLPIAGELPRRGRPAKQKAQAV